LFGSITNSGWYQSAGVKKGIGIYFGIPMNMTYIADADREYDGTWTDIGCQTAKPKNPAADCREQTGYTGPTAFGREAAPVMYTSVPDVNGNIIDSIPVNINGGLEDLAAMNWLPFAAPQLGVGFLGTELKLRYMGIPSIAGVSFSMPAVGLQHDISTFLPKPIPVPGLKTSVAFNMTWFSAEFEPGEDIEGKLELTGFSYFAGVLVGYKLLGTLEAFLEAGWEGANMKTGGNLVLTDPDDPANNETVKPNLDVDGRNGFRAALSFAFHFGYQAVVGQNFGAELGHNVNVLGYRF
jgi:hypothetical protein